LVGRYGLFLGFEFPSFECILESETQSRYSLTRLGRLRYVACCPVT
jgi:hypothetical protein